MTVAYKVTMANGLNRIVINAEELKELKRIGVVAKVKEIKNAYVIRENN